MASHSMTARMATERLRAGLLHAMALGARPGGEVITGSEPMTLPHPDATVTHLEATRAKADAGAEPVSFGRKGTLEVRLAHTPAEIDAAQALRYRVFYEEMSATPDEETRRTKRDVDRFDAFCDHLLVFDHALAKGGAEDALPPEAVVGCYRLLRQDVAERHGGFYTASEYDIAPLLEGPGKGLRFLELGRSCVLEPYRNKPSIELLWQGIGRYLEIHNLDVMFGCASFEGVDPAKLALPLSYLYHHHLTPSDWYVRALPERFEEMNLIPRDEIDARVAWRALPPMIKGYLRAGCYIGDGAVVDEQFGTTDVLIIFPVTRVAERYRSKFGAPNGG